MTKREPLKDRFDRFIDSLPDAERIDPLPKTQEQEDADKADAFFRNRSIVAEVKSLLTDTSGKIDPIMEPQRDREDYPQYYGEWPIGDVLERLSDGEILKKKLYEQTSSAIKGIVRTANRQIRETKRTFGLPDAGGVLIVLNDAVEVLNPDVVVHRIAEMLRKRNPDGSLQFPEIAGAWVISEKHLAQFEGKIGLATITMLNSAAPHPTVTTFLDEILEPWAAFNKRPQLAVDGQRYSDVKFSGLPEPTSDEVTLSEWSRRQYASRPYLRGMADDELLEYGGRLSDEMSLISASPEAPAHARMRATRRWADLNEEMNYRRMDIRDLLRQTELRPSPVFDTREFWELTSVLADVWDTLVPAPRAPEFP